MKYSPIYTSKFWCDAIKNGLCDEQVALMLQDFSCWLNHVELRDDDFEELYDEICVKEKCTAQIAMHFGCRNSQVFYGDLSTSDLFKEGFDPVVIIGNANLDGTWLGDLCNILFIAGETDFGEVNPYSIEPVKVFCGPVNFGKNPVSLHSVRYFGDEVKIPKENEILLDRYNHTFGNLSKEDISL